MNDRHEPRPSDPMRPRDDEPSLSLHGMLLGGAIAVGGALFLLDNLRLIDWGIDLWDLWPIAIVVFGLIKFADPADRRGAFWTIGAGIYCTIAHFRIWGLHWGEAWPVILIVGGLGILLDSLIGPAGKARSQENRDEA